MLEQLPALLKTVVSLLVVVDPIGAVPVFLGLTQQQPAWQRHQMARTAALAVFLILTVAALAGKWLLQMFGISLASFRVAGGVLFLLMGMDMLNARISRSRETPEEVEEASQRQEIAIVPMALPQLAGPGAIGSVILLADSGPFWPHILLVIGVVAFIAAVCYGALRMALPIGNALGQTGINILSRVMGLILIAVAAEAIVKGVRALWTA
ncbi:MAG: MarC family protein [Chloroherpetonaceae bacterium]|nr:NAAT family transporter [Chthonomonadaceae bacterium]MDW8208780.1 MarC family protein [Chloroherpetonaceae bacterium]